MFFNKVGVAERAIVYTTTSTTATWKPQTTKATTLTWEVTGDATGTYVATNPIIDLSGNTGTAIITATTLDWTDLSVITITAANCPNLITVDLSGADGETLTTINISSHPTMTSFKLPSATVSICSILNNDGLTTLDVTGLNPTTNFLPYNSNNIATITNINMPNVVQVQMYACNLVNGVDLTSFSSATLMRIQNNNMTTTATDQSLADMVTSGMINCAIRMRNNRTSASDADFATLQSRGCTFTFYTT